MAAEHARYIHLEDPDKWRHISMKVKDRYLTPL